MMNDKAPEFWVKKPDKSVHNRIVVNVKEVPVETKQIIYSLRDKACRADNPSLTRIMNMAANRLKELDAENEELKQRLFVHKELLNQEMETAHWIIHTSKDDIWAECSNCLTCGSPRWKVCPVCERKMKVENL